MLKNEAKSEYKWVKRVPKIWRVLFLEVITADKSSHKVTKSTVLIYYYYYYPVLLI
jgi:hypothetical protein